MYKKAFVLFVLFFCFSCGAKKDLVLLDSYFNSLYNIAEGKGMKNVLVIDPVNIEDLSFDGYRNLTITSLLYKKNYYLFENFEGNIKVIDYYGELKKDNHSYLNPLYDNFLKELEEKVFSKEDFNNIYFILKEGIDLGIEENVLIVDRKTTKKDISSYIKKYKDKKWVVIDNSFLSFINTELEGVDRVMIESEDLMLFHESVVASVEKKLKDIALDGIPHNVEIKKR